MSAFTGCLTGEPRGEHVPLDSRLTPARLPGTFGNIDIYVFDQLLRGRITEDMRVLDAGCGSGRNSEYLMRCGARVFGVDAEQAAIDRVRATAAAAAPDLPEANFSVARLHELTFPNDHFDAVICCAVLHFAETTPMFEKSLAELWRVLKPGGVFFARLASSIGIESRETQIRNRRYRLPDGSDRLLVDEDYLLRLTSNLGAEQLDPLKTTVVQNMRAMTTWVLAKR
ncbi:MAG: class I SAM-dependent methyltransferase [Gemmatimonadetes bacterium]|nr:class I SAM-dependent methyltransferase [Gemmatimonadota bacterium]